MKNAVLKAILKHLEATEYEFTLCDVGARGKLSADFDALYDIGQLRWIGFEPEVEAAKALEKKYPKAVIS